MNARADTAGAPRQLQIGMRSILTLLLFGVTLALLALGDMIIIPEETGFNDPVTGLRTAAMVSALAMLIVALPQREARRLLALMLGVLGLGLLALKYGDLSFRFLWQSDEGEFSKFLIAELAMAAILWASAGLGSVPAGAGRMSRRSETRAGVQRHSSLGDYPKRVLWSTPQRQAITKALAVFYTLVWGVWLVTGALDEDYSGGGVDWSGLAISAGVAVLAVFLARRTVNETLKTALGLVAAIVAFMLLLSIPGGTIVIVLGIHAAVAVAGMAAWAAAEDAPTASAKAGYRTLTVVAVLCWVMLVFVGAFVALLAASGYQN